MIAGVRAKKSPLKFIAFVYVLPIPFWIIGALTESATKSAEINLPTSALMAVCPIIAALIFTWREKEPGGVKRPLARIFDYKRINRKSWYAPIILLMPAVSILAYAVMRIAGSPLGRLSCHTVSRGAQQYYLDSMAVPGHRRVAGTYSLDFQ